MINNMPVNKILKKMLTTESINENQLNYTQQKDKLSRIMEKESNFEDSFSKIEELARSQPHSHLEKSSNHDSQSTDYLIEREMQDLRSFMNDLEA